MIRMRETMLLRVIQKECFYLVVSIISFTDENVIRAGDEEGDLGAYRRAMLK